MSYTPDRADASRVLQVRLRGCTLVFVPSVHGYGEFAVAARQVVAGCDAVALEMDAAMSKAFIALLRRRSASPKQRLPGCLALARRRAAADGSPAIEYVPLVSTDSMCEGARTALECGLDVVGIDRPPQGRVSFNVGEGEESILPDSSWITTPADLERCAKRPCARRACAARPAPRIRSAKRIHGPPAYVSRFVVPKRGGDCRSGALGAVVAIAQVFTFTVAAPFARE